MLRDPGRLAWTVLIISFLLFCVLTTTAIIGLRWFLFDSTTPLNAALTVGQNTVSVRESTSEIGYQAVRGSLTLSREARLVTDSASQGVVVFTDPYTHDVVATVTLHRDSTLTLGDASRPRFDFSGNRYIIIVQEVEGNIDVDIVPELPRAITVDVQSPYGDMLMAGTGRYSVTSRDTEFTLFNHAGTAVLINKDDEARHIAEGLEGQIDPDSGAVIVTQRMIDILPDGSFDQFNPVNEALSTEWGCYEWRDDPNAAPGEALREIINGRSVMHITRAGAPGQEATNHAENGCLQYLNTVNEPLPVDVYDYLELRATMQIRDRPFMLNACGQAGSECPVMIEIAYINEYGQDLRWIHGFYTRYDPAVGWPLQCDTCAQTHEQLNKDTWYTYSSGNLLQILPPEQRPIAIESVKFYASGHEYDVLLSDVALLAGNTSESSVIEAEGQPAATPEPTEQPTETVVAPTDTATPEPEPSPAQNTETPEALDQTRLPQNVTREAATSTPSSDEEARPGG